jgi:vitamin B12 transporter
MKMGVSRLLVASVAASFSMSGLAEGQATSQTVPPVKENVFVTATVSEIGAQSLSRTVAIVTREDLERMGSQFVVDALRLVPGIDPRARGPRDVQTDFSIRGSTFGQNLVLVDGLRLNDSQSGHHNAEIPVALGGVERIEVLYGAGSAVHGADALGGTINVISRRGPFEAATFQAGQYGYVAAEGSISGRVLPSNWSATGWASRSSGFMFDRDFAMGGAALRGNPTSGMMVDVRHQRRAFGANGFYGPSPSKEWTDGTLAAVRWSRTGRAWVGSVRGLYRDHHDHFLWDINRPGFAENRHRTDAVDLTATLERHFSGGRRATIGLAAGGDWITSSNLGDHSYGRASAFGELLLPIATRSTAQAGLRVDHYSTFGTSVNPSFSVMTQPSTDLRLHAGVSRAFRIPTFTELYYTDPGNFGNAQLGAESGWSLDAGADWTRHEWTFSFSPFRRWDENVIDWTKANPADRWHATNVRDVTSTGFEASASRRWSQALLRVYYALLTIDAPDLNMLSKYVLEYARHQGGGSISLPVGYGIRAAVNVDHRHRVDGQSYNLVSARISRPVFRAEIFVDGTNFFNATYHEIVGVAMPGRWITVGVTLR